MEPELDRVNVLFVLWRSIGHIHASLGLAKSIESTGHNVVYMGHSNVKEIVETQGFAFHQSMIFEGNTFPLGIGNLPSDLMPLAAKPKQLLKRIRDGRKKHSQFVKLIPEIVRELERILDLYDPAFLVFDPFLLYFYLPAYRRNIPAVALSTKPLATPDQAVPPYTRMTIPRNTLVSRIRISAQWKVQHLRYRCWEVYQRALFGGAPIDLAREFSTSCDFPIAEEWATRPILTDLRLKCVKEWVLHTPRFDFPRHRIDDAAIYLGPCVDFHRAEHSFDWSSIPEGKLIVCVLSTVLHPGSRAARNRMRFIRRLIEAMKELPDYVLICSARLGCSPSDLRIPRNVRIYESIPTLQAIQRAKLLITQGGGNIAKEAILGGVKMLTFPDNADQPGFSARLLYHGLSLRCQLSHATSRKIRSLILRSFADDSMDERLALHAQELRAFPTADLLGQEIDRLRNCRNGITVQNSEVNVNSK